MDCWITETQLCARTETSQVHAIISLLLRDVGSGTHTRQDLCRQAHTDPVSPAVMTPVSPCTSSRMNNPCKLHDFGGNRI